MSIDEDGNYFISDKKFNEEIFDDFTLNPPDGIEAKIATTDFVNCSTLNGSCRIMKGSHLIDVKFVEFDCGTTMHISSEVLLSNVKIIGKKNSGTLWIRPQTGGGGSINNAFCSQDICLDITEFYGEVSITGLPSNKIRIDPLKQVIIRADLLNDVEWTKMGLSALSYWKLMAKKVAVDDALDGVFSMPPKSGKNYERSIRELEILRSSGYL